MDRFSSLPSLPAPECLSVAEATHEYQAAMVTAHQRVLNVWEQASIARREQVLASKSGCCSIGKQLHKHLVSAGLFNGESNHGCRKGRMQEYAADGMDHAAMGKVAQPRLSPRLSVVLIWVGMRFARAMQGGTVSRL
ncbi:hypothetical protein WJX82_002779 [Trebouxia sp. C0006]